MVLSWELIYVRFPFAYVCLRRFIWVIERGQVACRYDVVGVVSYLIQHIVGCVDAVFRKLEPTT